MKFNVVEMEYMDTYYFAQVCNNVIHNSMTYAVNLDGFWGNDNHNEYISPFPKFSLCHMFIEYVIDGLIHENIFDSEDNAVDEPFWINSMLTYYKIKHLSYYEWLNENKIKTPDLDDIVNYHNWIINTELFDDIKIKIIKEVFYVLFQNRKFLRELNSNISGIAESTGYDKNSQHVKDNGTLTRTAIPKWIQRAVFFRDRGKCVFCHTDLSCLVSIDNKVYYDHIVPLSRFGLNDISNLQILCFSCNSKKSNKNSNTSTDYEDWYAF